MGRAVDIFEGDSEGNPGWDRCFAALILGKQITLCLWTCEEAGSEVG